LYELARGRDLPVEITLVEGKGQFGGVIETEIRNGFLLEGGPDSFLSEKPWALDLARRLGIEKEIIPTRESCRRSFILYRGRLVPVPQGFYMLAPVDFSALVRIPFLSWSGKLRMAMEPFVARRANGDESVGSFVRRRFGEEALCRVGQPMVGGIYTADPEALSLEATFPQFRRMEERHGSVLRGLWAMRGERKKASGTASGPRYSLFLSFRRGVDTLVKALVDRMPEVRLRVFSNVRALGRDENASPHRGGAWTVTVDHPPSYEADAVCLALPAPKAAALAQPFAPELARELASIPYESVATVNVGYRKRDIDSSMEGFGFVVPAVEGRKIVGCTYGSQKFEGRAPDDAVLLRAFVGGAFHHEMLALDDEELETAVTREIADILGLRARPLFVSIRRHPEAMPQYRVGHLALIRLIEAETRKYPGFYLTGNAFQGIGLPDCIRQAEEAAGEMMKFLEKGG
jgi:oxygen-dependent protoporphyrinogen oxidase